MKDASAGEKSAFKIRRLRGRMVWLAEELGQRYGIQTGTAAKHSWLGLKTDDGRLLPVIEDVRGRSFRQDKRLRQMRVELLVREYQQTPLLQIARVFSIEQGQIYEVDYWCEICAIPMYELKPCDCCQGPIELRKRISDGNHTPE